MFQLPSMFIIVTTWSDEVFTQNQWNRWNCVVDQKWNLLRIFWAPLQTYFKSLKKKSLWFTFLMFVNPVFSHFSSWFRTFSREKILQQNGGISVTVASFLWMHFDFFVVTQHTKVKMMVIGWNCIGGTALCASNKTHLCSTIITGEAAHTTRKILQVHHQEIKYRNSKLYKCEMNETHYILYFCKRAL